MWSYFEAIFEICRHGFGTMNSPARIPVHALKAGLSQYLKQLADGGSLIVTSHDRPVA